MTAAALKSILDLLPAGQHQSAQDRITESETYGWTEITLLRVAQQAGLSDERDLFGTKPSGESDFLP